MICTVHPSPTPELLSSSLQRSTRPSHVMYTSLLLDLTLFRIRLMTSSTLSLGDTISGNIFDPSTLTKIWTICRFFLTFSCYLGSCVMDCVFLLAVTQSITSWLPLLFITFIFLDHVCLAPSFLLPFFSLFQPLFFLLSLLASPSLASFSFTLLFRLLPFLLSFFILGSSTLS